MWLTLLANNTGHPEFEIFMESLDSIAASTGYRTDALAERLLQQARDETAEAFTRDPEPIPVADRSLTAS